jgi:HYDIN/CFA65/VesB family protein
MTTRSRLPIRALGCLTAGLGFLMGVGCSDIGRPVLLEGNWDIAVAALDFGSVAVLDSATRKLTVRNSGTSELTGDVTISCSEFRVVTGGGRFMLAPGATRDLVFRYRPVTDGASSCQLRLGPGAPPVTLGGVAVLQAPGARCAVEPDSIVFADILVGRPIYRTLTLRSIGTAPVRVYVQSPCAAFSPLLAGGPRILAAGDSMAVNVVFNPAAGGSFECVLATGPGCPEVRVRGFAATVSFSDDIQRIFDTHCTRCHGAPDFTPAAYPSLVRTQGYRNLVGVLSYAYPAHEVNPFDPDGSVLYGKVVNSGRFGPLMPQFGPMLPLAAREKIKAWILEGARDN